MSSKVNSLIAKVVKQASTKAVKSYASKRPAGAVKVIDVAKRVMS